MAVLPDFGGLGNLSLKDSVWAMHWVIVGWTVCVIAFLLTLQSMNQRVILDVLIFQITSDWFEVVTYTCWFLCVVWGFIAVSLPVRPREPKRAALFFWIFLILLHTVGHSVFIVMLCKRCHAFFTHSLLGNITKETVETFASKFAENQYVQTVLYLVTPVLNIISAPYVYQALHQIPPLDFLFWMGWNWVIVAFLAGVLPIICFIAAIPVVLGYVNAIDHGGNGTERCAPSKIALFYSLDYEDRKDVRRGLKTVESFQYDLSTGDEAGSGSSGGSGTHSSSLRSYTGSELSSEEEKGPKRIPSYKPNRSGKIVRAAV